MAAAGGTGGREDIDGEGEEEGLWVNEGVRGAAGRGWEGWGRCLARGSNHYVTWLRQRECVGESLPPLPSFLRAALLSFPLLPFLVTPFPSPSHAGGKK